MNFDYFNFIDSEKFAGKIILTSFPGLNKEGNFEDELFHSQLNIFVENNCSSITSFVEYKWETTKVLLKNELIEGQNIIFHCRGGKGRAGTIAAILLIDFSMDKKEAIELVRSRRAGAIETKKQEDFIFAYRAIA